MSTELTTKGRNQDDNSCAEIRAKVNNNNFQKSHFACQFHNLFACLLYQWRLSFDSQAACL